MPRQYLIRCGDGNYLGYGGQCTHEAHKAQPLNQTAAREWVARYGGEAVPRPSRADRLAAERRAWREAKACRARP